MNEASARFLMLSFEPIFLAMREACARVRAYEPALHVEDAQSEAGTYGNAPLTVGYRQVDHLREAIDLLAYEDDRDRTGGADDKVLHLKLEDFARVARDADKEWFQRRALGVVNGPENLTARAAVAQEWAALSRLTGSRRPTCWPSSRDAPWCHGDMSRGKARLP